MIAIIPYIPITFEELKLNKLHTGVLHEGEEVHFMVPKEKLKVMHS